MQLRFFAQGLCSRWAGLGLLALAGMLIFSLGIGTAMAQNQRINPRDSRVPEDYRLRSQLQESRLRAITETNYFNDRPLRCTMELSFSVDYPNVEAQSKRIGNPVAALKRVELGFERHGARSIRTTCTLSCACGSNGWTTVRRCASSAS